jgi:diacylglycerol kinase family enzyme
VPIERRLALPECIPVLINASGGTARRLGERCAATVEQAFAAAKVAVEIRMLPGSDIAAVAAELAHRELVVVGGGDGTLGSAAATLSKGGAALGILPLGTRNHLARELGVPLDLESAARLIAELPVRSIDLGRVGEGEEGHVFVNNASIGLYPDLVRRRDDHPAPKWLAALPAAAGALGRVRHHRLRLSLDGETQPVVTPLLFVGNNRYLLDREGMGTREALDDGKLSVYAVASRRRLAMIGFAVRTLLGRADPQSDFAAIGDVARLTVEGHGRSIDVALDGEVVRLPLPLRFRSDPGALKVIAPSG